jgi:hypothetical protein
MAKVEQNKLSPSTILLFFMLFNILKSLQEVVQNCDFLVFHVSNKQVVTTFLFHSILVSLLLLNKYVNCE